MFKFGAFSGPYFLVLGLNKEYGILNRSPKLTIKTYSQCGGWVTTCDSQQTQHKSLLRDEGNFEKLKSLVAGGVYSSHGVTPIWGSDNGSQKGRGGG